MRHRAPTVMFAALAVSVLLVGCSSSDKPGGGKSPSGGGDASTVPSQQPTPASSSGASGSSVPSGPPSVDPSASSLAQAGRGAVPGLSVAILSLARSSGDTVTMALRWALGWGPASTSRWPGTGRLTRWPRTPSPTGPTAPWAEP